MITVIAAVDSAFGIGKANSLPWHVPKELQFFKEMTQYKNCIVGRKTFDSLPPIKNRNFFVVSNQTGYTLQDALEETNFDAFVIGGASIFRQALPLAEQIILSFIDGLYPCDCYFPWHLMANRKTCKVLRFEPTTPKQAGFTTLLFK